jgi:nicotinamidase-related amidase
MAQILRARTEPIVPSRTALLLIDTQNGIVERATGEFADAMHQRAIPAMARLIDAARASGVEVIYTVIESLTQDGRDRSLDYKLTGFNFPRGSAEAKVIDALRPGEDEIVLPKTSSSLFNSTVIEYVLRNFGIDTVLVTGFRTDQCVDHTVRDGADRGFQMVCVADACAAPTQQQHDTALAAFAGYCRIADSTTIIAEMGKSGD